MTLLYHLADNTTGTVMIFDLTGRILKQYIISSKNFALNINESELAAGQYYLKIFINNKPVKTEKLSIIK